MKKNILEICLSPDFGGLELCVLDFFNYFQTKGNSYLCVAGDKKLDKYSQEKNKFTLKRNKFFPFLPALKLAKFIDKNQIDILHFHWTRDIATVVLAKIFSKRKPQIIQSRHMNITRFKQDLYHKWLYKNIDMIHAVTYKVKEQLEKFIPADIRPDIKMNYLGVSETTLDEKKMDMLKKTYELEESFILGIIGRIEENKGQFLLIEAISKLKDFNIKALIVGSAMSEAYLLTLKKRVKELDIEDKIIFTGFSRDINEHMSLCDVTVLATPKETFGLVVIESMINGVPVIATANGGPLEIIEDEKDGLLFDRTSANLVQKIEILYKDRVFKNNLARAAYKKVKEKFDKEKQMQKMYDLICIR